MTICDEWTCSDYCDVSRSVCPPGPMGRSFWENARDMCKQCSKEESPIIVVEESNFEDQNVPASSALNPFAIQIWHIISLLENVSNETSEHTAASKECLQYCDVIHSGCLPDPVPGAFCMVARRICNKCRKEQSPIIAVEEPNFEDQNVRSSSALNPFAIQIRHIISLLENVSNETSEHTAASKECLQYCDVIHSGCLPDPVRGGFCMKARRICNKCRKEQSPMIVVEEANFEDQNVPSPSECLHYCNVIHSGCLPDPVPGAFCMVAHRICNKCRKEQSPIIAVEEPNFEDQNVRSSSERRHGQRFSQVYASETGKSKNTSIDFVNASSTFGPEKRRHVPIHRVNTSHTPGPEELGNITTDIVHIFPTLRLEEQAKVLIEFTNATLGVLTNTLPAHDDQKQFLINSVDVILLNTLLALMQMTRALKSHPKLSYIWIATDNAIEELTQYRQQLLQQPLTPAVSSYDAVSKAQTEPPAESIDEANSDDQEKQNTDGHDAVNADLAQDIMVDELTFQLQRYLRQSA